MFVGQNETAGKCWFRLFVMLFSNKTEMENLVDQCGFSCETV